MDEEALKAKLIALKEEHSDLDEAIIALSYAPTYDQVQMQRLKKKKLLLKDRIMKLEAGLHPDIIA